MKKLIASLVAAFTIATQSQAVEPESLKWMYHNGDAKCTNTSKDGTVLVVMDMIENKELIISDYLKSYELVEYYNGSGYFQFFSTQADCLKFKELVLKNKNNRE
jgi:hypothetical protein